MVEGLAIIFIIFIGVQIVVFDKKEYGNLWVKLMTALIVFDLAVSPVISILILTGVFPSDSAWLFYLFTFADIIIAIIYFSRKVPEAIAEVKKEKNRPLTEKVYCPKCSCSEELPVPVSPEARCPYCQVPFIQTGVFAKTALHSDEELRIRNEKFSKIVAEIKAGPTYDPKATEWMHEVVKATLIYKNYRPKCPTCGSTLLYKIDLSGKEIGSMSEGFIDRKLGEAYRCDSCEYKW